MIANLLTLVLVLLLTTFTLSDNSFEITLQPHETVCFFENLSKTERLDLSFEVNSGGKLDVDFWILGPDKKSIYSVFKQETSAHGFNAKDDGLYEYCFANKMSSYDNKSLSFVIEGPDQKLKLESIQGSGPNHVEIEKEILQLAQSLSSVKGEQSYMVSRESTHRMTAKSTRSRVAWWSLFQTIVLCLVCYFQLSYVTRFFEVKRQI